MRESRNALAARTKRSLKLRRGVASAAVIAWLDNRLMASRHVLPSPCEGRGTSHAILSLSGHCWAPPPAAALESRNKRADFYLRMDRNCTYKEPGTDIPPGRRPS